MLVLNATLHKTELGIAALKDRERCPGLNPRLRTLLLQVDGVKLVEEMVKLAVSIGGSEESIEKMLNLGVVEAIEPVVEVVPEPEVVAAAPEAEPLAAPIAAPIATPVEAVASKPEPVAPAPVVEPKKPAEPAVSAKLPEHLKPTAMLMRKLADEHLGLSAMLLKRRISGADNEQELRLALRDLKEALIKAVGQAKSDELLLDVNAALPMIGAALFGKAFR